MKKHVTTPKQAASPATVDRWQHEVDQLRLMAGIAEKWARLVRLRANGLLASMQRSEKR